MSCDRRFFASFAVSALFSCIGIFKSLLKGALGNGDTLLANRKAGIVHHREHIGQSLAFFANQVAGRTPVISELQNRGWAGVNAKFVFKRHAGHVITRADFSVIRNQILRNDKQRNALDPGGRIGCAGQKKMHDILGHLVIAIGDENFLARNLVGPVVLQDCRAANL